MSDDSSLMEKKLTPTANKVLSKSFNKAADASAAQSRGVRNPGANYGGRQFRDGGGGVVLPFGSCEKFTCSGGVDRRAANFPAAPSQKQRVSAYPASQDKRGFQQQPRRDRVTDGAEVGSLARPGSKKGEIADYLNFSYDSPARREQGRFERQFTYVEPRRRVHSSSAPSYNKEQYLQANCQFIVSEGFDYSPHLGDPDLLVDWEHIEELRLLDHQPPSCPICLYPPVAAKITRCGHIYCWPCILHYLSLSDKQWRKCPICYESVYKNQLRSVVTTQVQRYDNEKSVTFRLMRREKGSNVSLPAAVWQQQHGQVGKVNGDCNRFAKLLTVSAADARAQIVEREREQLKIRMATDGDEPEACFIKEALESLDDREKKLAAAETLHGMPMAASGGASPPKKSFIHNARKNDVFMFTDAFNDVAISVDQRSAASTEHDEDNDSVASSALVDQIEENEIGAVAMSPNVHCVDRCYYFYQSDDGQLVFMNSLNARCLMREYGSLESAPQTVVGSVLQSETLVMSDDLRRRYRYLSHLPVSSVFALVEVKFDDGVLSPETIDEFSEEFVKRQRVRQRKARDVQRLHKQAERWEKAVLMDPTNFSKPAASMPSEIPTTTFVRSAQQEIEASFAEPSPPTTDNHAEDAPSFAQMLKQGKPKPTVLVVKDENEGQQQKTPDVAGNAAGGEDYLPAPSYRNTFEDALQAAFDNMSPNEEKVEGRKTKKQKNKGKLLFATGAATAPGHR